MWRLTQRVFKNGQLIGYVLTEENGLDEKILPKATVWELASNNFVLGVKPLKDGSIVGINGFELKKLPKYTEKKSESTLSEKRQERTKAVITIQDLMTAYLRKILRTENLGLFNSPDYCYMDELRKAFGEIIFEGDKGKSTRNSLSDTLNIEASIVDKHKNKIIGYIVKNNGTIDLEYQRILYKNYNTRIKRVLKPGEKVGLSVAEIVLLSSINKISMKFNNGKVINSIINQNLKTKFKVLKD